MMKKTITVAEIFGPTIAGEGPLIGKPTLFVRTGGCDFRCTWCDSMHAVDRRRFGETWDELETGLVWDRLCDLSAGWPMLVSLSGGNPALQPLSDLIDIGHESGYTFALETQGTIEQSWFNKLDSLIISPKGPSSGMAFSDSKLIACLDASGARSQVAFKFVVFNEADYLFARRVSSLVPSVPVYLSVGSPGRGALPATDDAWRNVLRERILFDLGRLVDRVCNDHWNEVTVLPQLHVLLWGDKQGV